MRWMARKGFPVLWVVAASTAVITPLPAVADCPPDCPMNLEADLGADYNGFPLDPRWRIQGREPGLPDATALCHRFRGEFLKQDEPCTTDAVTTNRPTSFFKKAVCNLFRKRKKELRGHLNWWPATFEGRIRWNKHAFDGDFTWEIETKDSRIITENPNRTTLHAEARGKESINGFRDVPWWGEFHEAVYLRHPAGETPDDLMSKNAVAVVTGLLNLDTVHQAYPELHPVYAMAMRVSSEHSEATGQYRDRWVLFARTWGGQGFCSSRKQPLDGLEVAECSGGPETECVWLGIELPVGPLEEFAIVDEADDGPASVLRERGGVEGPFISKTDSGLLVRFKFPQRRRRARRAIVYGELVIDRRNAAGYEDPWPLEARALRAPAAGPSPSPLEDFLDALNEMADEDVRLTGEEAEFRLEAPASRAMDLSSIEIVEPPERPALRQPMDRRAELKAGEEVDFEAEEEMDWGELEALCSGFMKLTKAEARERGVKFKQVRRARRACREEGVGGRP